MHTTRLLFALAAFVTFGTTACTHTGSAAGDIALSPADLANTAVLYTKNMSNEPIELRVYTTGQSRFIGAVSPGESNAIALDPSLLPAGELYVIGIAPDGRRRAIGGPLAVAKGNQIHFTIEPTLSLSRAYVTSP